MFIRTSGVGHTVPHPNPINKEPGTVNGSEDHSLTRTSENLIILDELAETRMTSRLSYQSLTPLIGALDASGIAG